MDKAVRNTIIAELYLAGRSLSEVGDLFNLTRERIRQILHGMGVKERHHSSTTRRAASEVWMEKYRGVKSRREARLRRNKMVIDMYSNAHMTIDDITAKTGMGRSTVYYILEKYEVKRRNGRLTAAQRQEVVDRVNKGERVAALANEFNIAPAYIYLLRSRR